MTVFVSTAVSKHFLGWRLVGRSAFTLLEVLVAIGLTASLLALLLTALSSVQETARRMHCQNNLRQQGLAAHNYIGAIGLLPPAVIWAPAGEPLGGGVMPIGILDRVARTGELENDTIFANWAIMLLSYLEASNLRIQFDDNAPISSEVNKSVRECVNPIMQCPSDPCSQRGREFRRGFAHGLTDNIYARGNYAINVGPDADCLNGRTLTNAICADGFFANGRDLRRDNSQVWGGGIAGINKSFRSEEITRGLSHVICVDEVRAGVDPADPRGVWALGQIGSSMVARHGRFSDAASPNYTSPNGDEFIGCFALASRRGMDTLVQENMGCALTSPGLEINAQAGAKSSHPGGVNCLRCDGGVQFITDEVDPYNWHSLHTRTAAD